MNKTKSVFFPNLDALRFFCFFSVFFFHSFATKYLYILSNPVYKFIKYTIFRNGNLGVNFFFVLSGFLITYLLIVEKNTYKFIDIKKFYLRRILRIWPLFYFCVFFGFFIFPILKTFLSGNPSTETASLPYYLLFINNFDSLKKGLPDSSILSILWSVAIEEQFYFFWPLLLAFLNRKYLPYLFITIIIGSFVFRFYEAYNTSILEGHTLSCISDLTVGGLAAYFIFYSDKFKNIIISLSPLFIVIIYILSIVLFLFRSELFNHNRFTISLERLVISFLFILIILEQNYSQKSLFKLHRFKKISKLGKYSYGLYCLHMIGILIIATLLNKLRLNTNAGEVILLEGSLSFLLTLLLAYLSYHFYEKKFLKLKNRFELINTKPI